MPNRYDAAQLDAFADAFRRDGHLTLKDHFPKQVLERWKQAFHPLLDEHIAREGHLMNRGSARYYITLPFEGLFADPAIYEDEDILALVDRLVGPDPVMVQLATDTPLKGSDFQPIHRDTPPLFPEAGIETPPFQLAVNFPLVDVTVENGATEIATGTHMMERADGLRRIENGEIPLRAYPMALGDVMIRDVRHLHRGTPNHTDEPRPMVVIGYSRRWLFRPEVSITIPRAVLDGLSERARRMLRFNPVVETLADAPAVERYQAFAY